MQDRRDSLDEIFAPRSVAVVGATETAGKSQMFSRLAVVRLKAAGFPAIYPVNPNRTQVFGLPCYPSLSAIPGEVDHVVVAIPAEAALGILDECRGKAVRSVQMFTGGFSEGGADGRADLEKSILAKARGGGFRVLGPNCMGMFVPRCRFTTWADVPMQPGPIGLFCQSGGFAEDVPYLGDGRGLRFSKVVSYGNGLDVNECELLEYFARDAETEIIGAYIEGVRDGRRFVAVLREAAAVKPVVIYKGGATPAGGRAARGHTASLAGSADVFRVLCRQANAVAVDSLEELVDTLVAFCFIKPLPEGAGVAVVGRGGGISVLAGDEIESAGLTVPPLAPEVQAELKEFLPVTGGIFANPIDAASLQSPEAVLRTMRVLGQVRGISVMVYHLGFHPASRWSSGALSSETVREGLAGALAQVPGMTGKPVIVVLNPPPDQNGMSDFFAMREALMRARIPVFHKLRGAALAVRRIAEWSRRRVSSRPGATRS